MYHNTHAHYGGKGLLDVLKSPTCFLALANWQAWYCVLVVDGVSSSILCCMAAALYYDTAIQAILYSSVNTVVEFHSEVGEIQCIFAP